MSTLPILQNRSSILILARNLCHFYTEGLEDCCSPCTDSGTWKHLHMKDSFNSQRARPSMPSTASQGSVSDEHIKIICEDWWAWFHLKLWLEKSASTFGVFKTYGQTNSLEIMHFYCWKARLWQFQFPILILSAFATWGFELEDGLRKRITSQAYDWKRSS